MKVLSVQFSGIGDCTLPYNTDFPRGKVSIVQMKTGGRKTLACEAILHAFGYDISSFRSLNNMKSDNIIDVTVNFEQDNNWMSLQRIDNGSTVWILKANGQQEEIAGKETLAKRLGSLSIDVESIKNHVITEQAASVDMTSIVNFLEWTSKDRRTITKYLTVLTAILGACQSKLDEINRIIDSPVDITSILETVEKNEERLENLNKLLVTLNGESRQNIERRGALEKQLKSIIELSGKIDLNDVKIRSMTDLVKTKRNNIAECETKLEKYGKGDVSEEITQCARKTEVSLDAELRDLESRISSLLKKKGSLDLQIEDVKIKIETSKKQREDNEKVVSTETAKLIALGMDESFEKEAVLKLIAKKKNAMAEDQLTHKQFSDELSIAKNAIKAIKEHELDHCPCCGHAISSSAISKRINDLSGKVKSKEMTMDSVRAEMRGLRKYDDIKRSMETAKENGIIIAMNMADFEKKSENIDKESKEIEATIRDLEAEKDKVLSRLKAEEREINAAELVQKIDVAKSEIEEIEQKIKGIKEIMIEIAGELAALPKKEIIESEISGFDAKSQEYVKKIVSAETEKMAIQMRITDLSARVRSTDGLRESKALIERKINIVKSHISMAGSFIETEEAKIKSISKSIGRDVGFNVISMNESKNEMIRVINGSTCKQNPISMSTGEKVMAAATVTARNGGWKDGGFALIDANLSADLIHECAETLVNLGCEQVVFMMTGDENTTIEVPVK